MIALAALLILLFLAFVSGSAVLNLLRLPLTSVGRAVYGTSLGLGVISYLVLILGLVGALRIVYVVAALGLLLLMSLVTLHRSVPRIVVYIQDAPDPLKSRWIPFACGLLAASAGIVALINCYVPPATNEWDALSYHLAAPKIFLQEGRIVYLPTDHHSNFPFSMQMLFTLGLMFNGFALANLLHIATAVLTAAALFVIDEDRLDQNVRWVALAVFVTCPLVVWQAGAAYVELGFAMYVVAAVGALLEFRSSNRMAWLALCAILTGFALSVKTLALIPLALTVGALVLWRIPARRLAAFLGIAVVVGCPFYVKSWIVTGNPVYPFGYRVFGGRDWNAELAETYASEHRSFGQSANTASVGSDAEAIQIRYKPPGIADKLRNLALAPFELVAIPRIFHNFNNPGIHSHIGFLLLSLLSLILVLRGASTISRVLVGFCACWFLIWSQTMQYARYLLPMVPLLGLAAGEGAVRASRSSRVIGAVVVCAFVLQAALTLGYFGRKLPDQFRIATNRDAREQYLTSAVNVYAAQQWLNKNTGAKDGVVLFEETRGFYLDRPYLWGNGPHSLYIPYDRFSNGQEMARWFMDRGYRYAILNLQFSPHIQSDDDHRSMMVAIASGTAAALIRDWYADQRKLEEVLSVYRSSTGRDSGSGGFRDVYWRLLLGDAVANGGAVINHDASSRGAVVLEFRPS